MLFGKIYFFYKWTKLNIFYINFDYKDLMSAYIFENSFVYIYKGERYSTFKLRFTYVGKIFIVLLFVFFVYFLLLLRQIY